MISNQISERGEESARVRKEARRIEFTRGRSPRSLCCANRRAKNARKKKPARSGRDDKNNYEFLGILGEKGVGDGMEADGAVLFVFGEIANADASEVGGVTLVDLLKRKILFLNIVGTGLHVLAVLDGRGHHGTSLLDADTKLAGGRFVVGDEETMADAGAVGDVEINGAVIVRGEDGRDGAGAEGERARDVLGAGFHAIHEGGVLIDENEEDGGEDGIGCEMPEARRQSGEPAESEDDGDEREARGEGTDPAAGGVTVKVFGKNDAGEEGEDKEFDEDAAVFPEVGARRWEEGEGGAEKEKELDGVSEEEVALAEDMELLGAGQAPDGSVAPLDLVAVMADIPSRGENAGQSGKRKRQLPPARKLEPEKAVDGAAEE